MEAGWRWEGTGHPAEAGQCTHGEWKSEMMDGSSFTYSVLKKKQSWTVAGAGRCLEFPRVCVLSSGLGRQTPVLCGKVRGSDRV